MTPRAIAIVSSKGGVGKTTIATALAVRASKDSRKVAILDLDPQQAAARWWELRGEPSNPKLFPHVENAASDVALLKENGWEWIIIDSPPGAIHLLEDAVAAADFVLIPVRPSPIDIEAVHPALELCEQYGRRFAFVITHYDKSWKLSATAAPVLADYGPVLKESLGYRQAYVGAMLAGKTGPEHQDSKQATAARSEINALWTAISKRVKSTTPARAR